MRDRLLALVVLSLAFAALARSWSGARARRISRDRLRIGAVEAEAEAEEPGDDEPLGARPFQVRHRWVPWAALGLVFAVANYLVGLKTSYSLMFGVIVALLLHEIEEFLTTQKSLKIEAQLADAIDLMVASLRAGASVMSSLETAVGESRVPLRPQMEEVLGRIRYGDNPTTVYRGLMARVPLETFRLFGSALTVHEEVGGSLAPTLATVGRIIRDRIELTRRIRSLTVQSRISTVAILGTTYFIALMMWRTDPPRMEEFLTSPIGSGLFSGAVMLQALGVFWTSWLSRLKY